MQRAWWCEAVALRLRESLAGDDDIIRDEVERGVSELYSINSGESYFVTRGEGTEVVIVCFAGSNLKTSAREIVRRATQMGFKTMRWHTTQLALTRMLAFLNPEPVEYVLKVQLNGR